MSERTCRVCGCSDYDACVNVPTGECCRWVGVDLCSGCDPVRVKGMRLRPASNEADAKKLYELGMTAATEYKARGQAIPPHVQSWLDFWEQRQ